MNDIEITWNLPKDSWVLTSIHKLPVDGKIVCLNSLHKTNKLTPDWLELYNKFSNNSNQLFVCFDTSRFDLVASCGIKTKIDEIVIESIQDSADYVDVSAELFQKNVSSFMEFGWAYNCCGDLSRTEFYWCVLKSLEYAKSQNVHLMCLVRHENHASLKFTERLGFRDILNIECGNLFKVRALNDIDKAIQFCKRQIESLSTEEVICNLR